MFKFKIKSGRLRACPPHDFETVKAMGPSEILAESNFNFDVEMYRGLVYSDFGPMLTFYDNNQDIIGTIEVAYNHKIQVCLKCNKVIDGIADFKKEIEDEYCKIMKKRQKKASRAERAKEIYDQHLSRTSI
jgi:hypothetical protein